MQTDPQAIEHGLHPQPGQSQAGKEVLREAPGPPAKLLGLLHFLMFGSPRDLLSLYMDAARQYGDVVRFGRGPWLTYFVSHPDYVKHVLQDNNHNYCKKNQFNDLFKLVVGEGLLTSDGDVWRRRRKLAQPAFHREKIASFAVGMTDSTLSMLECWATAAQDTRPLDMMTEMQELATTIVGQALFGTDLSQPSTDEMQRDRLIPLEYLNRRMRRPLSLPVWVPTRTNLRFRKAMRLSDDNVFSIINAHREAGKDTGDLLSMLLAARDEETGEGLNDQELRDEVMTFLGAGNETTAVTLTWVWYLLSKHPDVERRLHAELDAVLGGRTPTVEDVANLTYTRMIIDETLRLYPAAWAIGRGIVDDDEIGGYRIKKGTMLILSPYVTHRRPDIWDNPEGFDPERFTPERVAERPRYAYFPFGGGPRQCIGNTFALMEAQLVLATVAQKYRLSLVPGCTVEPDPIFTLRPNRAVLMALQPR